MNLILFGAGTYVLGKDEKNMAPMGSAIVESFNQGLVKKLFIVTNNKDTAINAAKKFNYFCGEGFAKSFNDHDLGEIESNNTCAIISVPDSLHYKILKECGEKGINALVVKPFVERVNQAIEIRDLFKSKKLLGCVEFHKRFDEANRLIKQKLNNSTNKISRIFVDYSQPKAMPLINFKKWTESSNIFQYLGVHYVDLIAWMTGFQPYQCTVHPSGNMLSCEGVETPDNIDVIIKWKKEKNKFNSFHMTSWAESNRQPFISRQKIEILGDKFRIDSDQSSRGFISQSDEMYEIINPYFCQDIGLNKTNLNEYKSKFSGYGVTSVLVFLKYSNLLLQNKIDLDEIFAESDLCSFNQAILSTKVIQSVNKCISEGLESIEIN